MNTIKIYASLLTLLFLFCTKADAQLYYYAYGQQIKLNEERKELIIYFNPE